MTDERRLPDPSAAIEDLPPGAAVVLRHYDAPASERQALAHRLAATCRRRGLRLLVAADPELAISAGAAGVHLPEAMLKSAPQTWRLWRRRGWMVTAAAHSSGAIRRAAAADVDAVLLSPVFATRSHPDARALGSLRFAALTRASPVPVYALGGIDTRTLRRLSGSGAAGVAGIGGFGKAR
ncbi:MAG: thiamine phosphate synthase [Rhodospirillales bacterium]|nr:thiamine phosphate synthase [Rhodospirillales bacterium]